MIKLIGLLFFLVMQASIAKCSDIDFSLQALKLEAFSREFKSLESEKSRDEVNRSLIGHLLLRGDDNDFILINKYIEINQVSVESYPFLTRSGRRYDLKSIALEDYVSKLESKNPKLKELQRVIDHRAETVFSSKNPTIGLTPKEVSTLEDLSFLGNVQASSEALSLWALCKRETCFRYYDNEVYSRVFRASNNLDEKGMDDDRLMKKISQKIISTDLIEIMDKVRKLNKDGKATGSATVFLKKDQASED
ncbi:hypothetical protein [Roseibacillus ishigakijimensis]|uniref:Uncharacterized protein n=1 Tax=Roseibacillus ishigakijimensis TaxID=454146 RepID=A0A934VP26_9BACT|nr:hypothetical protein [Roseibacillus ishigakijimensis]MBK1835666.1 hypothetical protein [Roseibacillus ishigakijimensis]